VDRQKFRKQDYNSIW